MSLFNRKPKAIVQTVELTVDDTFEVVISISDTGNQFFRNVACGLRWPVSVVSPRVDGTGKIVYTDGDLMVGQDLIVKQVGDEIGISKTLKSGLSISRTGLITTIQFVALAAGEGEVLLVNLEANDVENGVAVSRATASEGSVSVKANAVIPPVTGTVLFKVRVVV